MFYLLEFHKKLRKTDYGRLATRLPAPSAPKLKEFYGKIPETLSEADYEKFDWWTGVPE